MIKTYSIRCGIINIDDEKTMPERGERVIVYPEYEKPIMVWFTGDVWSKDGGLRFPVCDGDKWAAIPDKKIFRPE